jgi:hypothetical protein
VGKRKKAKAKAQSLTEWNMMLCTGMAAFDVLAEPWGPWWAASVHKGERDCSCCGKTLDMKTDRCAVLVGATKVGRQWLIGAVCSVCAWEHTSMEAAGEAMCRAVLSRLGQDDVRVIRPMPGPDGLQ